MKKTLRNALLLLAAVTLPLGFASCGGDDEDTTAGDFAQEGTGEIRSSAGYFFGNNDWYRMTWAVNTLTTYYNYTSFDTEAITFAFGYNSEGVLNFISEQDDDETISYDLSNPNLIVCNEYGMNYKAGITYNDQGFIKSWQSDYAYEIPAGALDEDVPSGNIVLNVKAKFECTYDAEGHLTSLIGNSQSDDYDDDGFPYIHIEKIKYTLSWNESGNLVRVVAEVEDKHKYDKYTHTDKQTETFTAQAWSPLAQPQWESASLLPFRDNILQPFFMAGLFGTAGASIPKSWTYARTCSDSSDDIAECVVTEHAAITTTNGLISVSESYKNNTDTRRSFAVRTAFSYQQASPRGVGAPRAVTPMTTMTMPSVKTGARHHAFLRK